MSNEPGPGTADAQPSAADRAERRRMSAWDLFFLAAGGVIGSGWLLSPVQADQDWTWPVLSWGIGGVLMLVITAVIVELSIRAPKTGGLIFLPLQSSGPLFATVVAAAVWAFYTVNPASEAVAMVRGLAAGKCWPALVNGDSSGLSGLGIVLAVGFLAVLTAVNLLRTRAFLTFNNCLTVFKILVPLLVLVMLLVARVHPPAYQLLQGACLPPPDTAQVPHDVSSMLSAVAVGGVVYAYLGFQGPLDFAGNVRRRGIREATRLRCAVYGAVGGAGILYILLQLPVIYVQQHLQPPQFPVVYLQPPHFEYVIQSPVQLPQVLYTEFAGAVAPGWGGTVVGGLVNADAVASPAGTGMVFIFVLTREVAALSRAHLTHRGLQRTRYPVVPLAGRRLRELFRRLRRLLPDDRPDLYWRILGVDLVFSIVFTLLCLGRWSALSGITSFLSLIAYSTPSVVLAALRRRDRERIPGSWYSLLAGAGFVLTALILFLAGVLDRNGWDTLRQATVTLTAGCAFLFVLPLVVRLVPRVARWYDATAYAVGFRQLRTDPAAQSAALLYGFFAGLALLSLAAMPQWPVHASGAWDAAGVIALLILACLAGFAFHWLVKLSVRYMDMEGHSPTLPDPMPGRAGTQPREGPTEGNR